MTPKHKQRLDEIGFAWSSLDQKWWEHFDKLLQFKETEGHCNVPLRFELEGFRLGRWVGMQRTKQISLSHEYKQRLNEVGFIWDPRAEQWEEGFSRLVQFKERESHCKVFISVELDGFKLGAWVFRQRRSRDRLSTERKQRLDDLGFIWDLKEGKPND